VVRKLLMRGSFTSMVKPFKWTYQGKPLVV